MDRDVERSFAALQLQEDPGPRRRPVPMRSRIRRLSDVLREPHANGDDAAARHSQRRPSGHFNGIRDNGQTQSGSNQLQLQVYQNPARNQQSSSQHALNNINNINNTHNERQGRRRSKRTSIILIEHGGSGSQSPNPVDILPAVYKIQQPQAPQPHAPQVQNPQLQNLPVRFVTAPPPQQPVVPISENLQLAPIGFNQETVIHHPPPNFFYPQHLQPMEPQFYQQPFIDFAPVNGIFDNSGHFIPQPFIMNGANGIMPIQRECVPQPIPQPNIPLQHNFMPPPIQYTVPPPVLPQYPDARNLFAPNLSDFPPELNQNHQNPTPAQRIYVGDSNGGNRVENHANGEQHESGRNFRRRDDKKPQLVDGQLIKSALCRNILAHGRCDYGDRCHFAHDIEELTLKPASDNFKTVECMEHSTTGQCPYGYKCHYFHEGEDPYMRRINDTRSVADFMAAKEEFQRAKEAAERCAAEPAPSKDDPGPKRANPEPSFNFTG